MTANLLTVVRFPSSCLENLPSPSPSMSMSPSPSNAVADLWPSLIQKNLPHDRCIVRFLGTPPPHEETAAPLTKEVDWSSLVKFPGGQRLMVLTERLPPLGQGAKKEDKNAQVAEEFLLPANKENRVREKQKQPTPKERVSRAAAAATAAVVLLHVCR